MDASPSTIQPEARYQQRRFLTGSIENRVQHYWANYKPKPDPELTEPSDLSIVLSYQRLSRGRLDEAGMLGFLATLNTRIELDDGANRLAEHLMSHKGQSGKPSIKSWTTTGSYSVETMEALGTFFFEIQSRLSPGWTEVLPNKGLNYYRPASFLGSIAHKLGYTVEEFGPVVMRFFDPNGRTSLQRSASLPNFGLRIDGTSASVIQRRAPGWFHLAR
ncbi:hypothetical protein B0H16DRAFT_1536921 [Mycena metata]|uniref:Uncharacterized protein n=1 Tax=Mycena metata TaxID=1033252 RepID=A0AAD7J8M6_9AGAR|nr:hypothetical protein B0H16DRAFT_1536921 [Mycena metata]